MTCAAIARRPTTVDTIADRGLRVTYLRAAFAGNRIHHRHDVKKLSEQPKDARPAAHVLVPQRGAPLASTWRALCDEQAPSMQRVVRSVLRRIRDDDTEPDADEQVSVGFRFAQLPGVMDAGDGPVSLLRAGRSR